jgi:large subunit ribosomal protein L13
VGARCFGVPALPESIRAKVNLVRTYSPKPGDVTRQWHVIDATDVVLGRLASQIAILLRGKHKPIFAPHLDTGDFVIVVNADKVALTGNKRLQKMAYRHSGYPGGLTATPYRDLLAERPDRAIEKAVRGMLPHTSLGRAMLKKLKVYAGPDHPHQAQGPVPFQISQVAQ